MARQCYLSTAGLLPGHWKMFKEVATYNIHTDLQEYTESLTAYIKKCIDDVTVTKTITTHANQKPWMTAEVYGLLKTRYEAFRSGDKAALKTARANLSCGIKTAKWSHAQKINNHFTDSRDTAQWVCGNPFRPSLTISPHHRPVMMKIPPRCTQPLLFTVWNAEWHTGTKTAHTYQWPLALSVSSWRKEDPI